MIFFYNIERLVCWTLHACCHQILQQIACRTIRRWTQYI